MTLLLATLSRNQAVLTADGLCTKTHPSGEVIYLENHRKLWALPDRPIAFAHHGQNIIAGLDVWQFVEGHIAQHADEIVDCGAREIAHLLVEWFGVEVRRTLQQLQGDHVIGFWVAGYGRASKTAELWEIVWPVEPVATQHSPLVIGGSAKSLVEFACEKPVGSFRWQSLPSATKKHALAYHNLLYRMAEDRQRKEDLRLFGGHKHQLVILRSGCRWEIEPPSTSHD